MVALLGVELMAEPAPPTHGGDDGVGTLNGGTFNGGSGTDQIDTTLDGGTFNGGSGDDFAEAMSGGTFNGGPRRRLRPRPVRRDVCWRRRRR